MANLGFSNQKVMSVALLLMCIFGSLFIDSLMKSKEGFQEGLKASTSENDLKKSINTVLQDTKKNSKEINNNIQDIITKYMKDNNINSTVNEVINILSMKVSDDKKVNLISVLLSSNK